MSDSSSLPVNQPVTHVDTDMPNVAITFDDGPDDVNVPILLKLFAAENIKATFFAIGQNVLKFPAISRQIVETGHEIGNHTQTHLYAHQCTGIEQVRDQIVSSQQIIEATTGKRPVLFRAPGLEHDERIWTVINELGLPSINAAHDSRDWDRSLDARTILNNAITHAKAGDVILFHSWNDKTVQIMPEVIKTLKERGLEMVTVAKLLEAEKK